MVSGYYRLSSSKKVIPDLPGSASRRLVGFRASRSIDQSQVVSGSALLHYYHGTDIHKVQS